MGTPCDGGSEGGSSVPAGCAESFNSNEFSHHHVERDKSMTFAAFPSRRCFGTFCAWFTRDLLKQEVCGWGNHGGQPSMHIYLNVSGFVLKGCRPSCMLDSQGRVCPQQIVV